MGRPAVLVAAFLGTIALALLATHDWDPDFFATSGPQWQRHDPDLSRQADGTIFREFATDPVEAAHRRPRFRTARILYPLAARALALGRVDLVPWTLLAMNLVAIVLGAEIVHRLLRRRQLPPWAALAYGGWGGLGLALLHDTSEPLAYLCALLGIAWLEADRVALAGAAFVAALLTRETAVLLVAPYLLLGGPAQGRRRWTVVLAVAGVWASWMVAVAAVSPGPSSPEAMPALPLAGYRATRLLDAPLTVAYLLMPAFVVMGLALWELRSRRTDPALWAVALNALLVVWLPPKTAELLWHSSRIATGMVVATLLATSIATSFPRAWRALAALFASSAVWTAAVAARYLLWDVRPW